MTIVIGSRQVKQDAATLVGAWAVYRRGTPRNAWLRSGDPAFPREAVELLLERPLSPVVVRRRLDQLLQRQQAAAGRRRAPAAVRRGLMSTAAATIRVLRRIDAELVVLDLADIFGMSIGDVAARRETLRELLREFRVAGTYASLAVGVATPIKAAADAMLPESDTVQVGLGYSSAVLRELAVELLYSSAAVQSPLN